MTLSKQSLARDEICRIGKSLYDRGYVHAAAGNISVQVDDGFLITPTDACLGFLDPARLALLKSDGAQVSGDKASKTIALHARIYGATALFDTKAQCILHTHSTHCVGLSLQGSSPELLAPITPYFVMKVGHVPVMPYQRPGSPQTVDDVARTISDYGARGMPLRAVMLARLGPCVWHDSPAAAMAMLEELEETARLTTLYPDATPLNDAQIEELRQAFGAVW